MSDLNEGSLAGIVSPFIRDNLTFYLMPPNQESVISTISAVDDHGDIPTAFSLLPCRPNPFNPTTKIAYDLPIAATVKLSIYDTMGRLVTRLRSGAVESPGRHEVVWKGRDARNRIVAAGVYLYRIEAGAFSETKRMVLVK